jgi:hypothetical protein
VLERGYGGTNVFFNNNSNNNNNNNNNKEDAKHFELAGNLSLKKKSNGTIDFISKLDFFIITI